MHTAGLHLLVFTGLQSLYRLQGFGKPSQANGKDCSLQVVPGDLDTIKFLQLGQGVSLPLQFWGILWQSLTGEVFAIYSQPMPTPSPLPQASGYWILGSADAELLSLVALLPPSLPLSLLFFKQSQFSDPPQGSSKRMHKLPESQS